MVECARRIHEVQLEAAVEAHASAEATRKQLQGARDPQELWRIQSEWLAACLKGSLSYWSEISQAVLESQASIAASLGQPSAALLQGAAPMQMMDSAYQQWLAATRKVLAAPAA
jgi:phasin protein